MVMSARLRYPDRVTEPGVVDNTRGALPTHALVAGATVSTTRGDVRAEMLRVGDMLRTRDGHTTPLTAVAARIHQSLSGNLRPIVFKAGSIAHGIPKRNLAVLPDQPMAKPGAGSAPVRPAKELGWRTITQPLVSTHVKFILLTCRPDAVISVGGVWAAPCPTAPRLEAGGRPAGI